MNCKGIYAIQGALSYAALHTKCRAREFESCSKSEHLFICSKNAGVGSCWCSVVEHLPYGSMEVVGSNLKGQHIFVFLLFLLPFIGCYPVNPQGSASLIYNCVLKTLQMDINYGRGGSGRPPRSRLKIKIGEPGPPQSRDGKVGINQGQSWLYPTLG